MSTASITARNRHNALARYRPKTDPDLQDAKRDLRAALAEAYINELVASAPPLSAAQRDRLASLLRPNTGTAA